MIELEQDISDFEFNITPEEVLLHMKTTHQEKMAHFIDQIIRYCRKTQKEFQEQGGDVSGVDVLNQLLGNGKINMSLLLKIRLAVENYNTPYEIIH